MERRGVQESAINIDNSRVLLKMVFPLSEIIVDFHDKLKSVSSGFASFDYEDLGFQPSSLIKVSTVISLLFKISFSITSTVMWCAATKQAIPRQLTACLLILSGVLYSTICIN